MRIEIPESEDAFAYVTEKLGSPMLRKTRIDAWLAQYISDSPLTPRERESARIRSAHYVGCGRCVAFRPARDMPGFSDEPIPEEFYENVFNYESWPGYSERERLILEFGERYTPDYEELAADEAFWTRLKASFSDVELGDLCILIGWWDWSVRMYHVLGGVKGGCVLPQVSGA
jgi:alkylhydroperoxidase family enzyme